MNVLKLMDSVLITVIILRDHITALAKKGIFYYQIKKDAQVGIINEFTESIETVTTAIHLNIK